MTEITFNITVDGENDDPLFDATAVDDMIDSTRTQIRQHILKRVGDLKCDQHAQAARVIVSGTYSLESEQLEIQYGIEACCNAMIMKTAALLGKM
ncbi:MAG: hypothetical protein MUF87_13760 [Anaerolineae bacterium]|jgi:hypothetical protein|nr:hypothetical protein [Anaerolineae bacterium]